MEEDIIRRAAQQAEFTNDIGMVRKGKHPEEPSEILWEVKDVEFCSHWYDPVEFVRDDHSHVKYMPTRTYAEIFGKLLNSGSVY